MNYWSITGLNISPEAQNEMDNNNYIIHLIQFTEKSEILRKIDDLFAK